MPPLSSPAPAEPPGSPGPNFRPISLRDAAITVAGATLASAASPHRWVLIDDFERHGRRYLVARLADDSVRTKGAADRQGGPRISTRDLGALARGAQGQSVNITAIQTHLAWS